MSQKDPVGTASDFWSASGITSYFQNLICCGGCGERKDKSRNPTNAQSQGNYNSALDESWMTEEYYEIPGATLPTSDTNQHGVNCRNERSSSRDHRENLRPRNLETGKGVTYHESDDGNDDDDDALSVSSKVSTRKKISKPKTNSKLPATNSRSASKGRNPWQPAEDETLKNLIKQHGKRWSIISKMMGGTRNGKQIRDRWMNKLDPSIHEKVWTLEEDRKVVMLWQQFGNRWSEIAKHLEGRTESMVKNRYYSHLAKKVIANESHSPTMSLNTSNTVSPTARGPTQLNGQLLNQQSGGYGSQVIRFPNQQPSAQFYENGQIGQNGHQYVQPQNPGVQYLYPPVVNNTNSLAQNGVLISDDQFINWNIASNTQNPKIPLLPVVDPLFSNDLELKLSILPSVPLGGYLDFDKVPSNNSARSRPKHSQSYNSLEGDQKEDKTMLYNLLNLRNNFEHMPGAIPETDETRSDIIGTNPYGYEASNGNMYAENQNGHHFYGQKDFDQNSAHETTYSEQIRKRFGAGGVSDDTSEFSSDFKDMDIEGQIDKLVLMIDSRTVSTTSQVPNLSKQNSTISNETDKNYKVNVLKRREMTLKYLLERTHMEIQKSDDPSYYRQSSIESSVVRAI